MSAVPTLLIHDHTFARVGARLDVHRDKLSVVTMDVDGVFRAPWCDEVLEALPEPDLAFGNGDVWFNPKAGKYIAACMETPSLKWFQSSAAGLDFPALAKMAKKAEAYTTCHVQAESMGEWAIWAALDFFRDGPKHRASQQAKSWDQLNAREVSASRWLIIGFGSIGEAVGRRVRALGGHVTGVRRSGGSSEAASEVLTAWTPEHVGSADVVLLCVPPSPETEGMADADFFAAMRPDALFMNLGRGVLVDEAAMLSALDAGRPAFAALDVVSEEPLPEESPIWSHPKVMLTPHDSSMSIETDRRIDEVFLANLDRYMNGEPLKHLVG